VYGEEGRMDGWMEKNEKGTHNDARLRKEPG
jgi:hypothetical protein